MDVAENIVKLSKQRLEGFAFGSKAAMEATGTA
jgi:hypothetical protein